MLAEKFREQKITAKGEERAYVDLDKLKTLWINSGTQCNLSCKNCYIESSPQNDRLVFFSEADTINLMKELEEENFPTELVGLTGGEPFLNPEIIGILKTALKSGKEVLVLTNALRLWSRHKEALLELHDEYGASLHIRVSLDHYTQAGHEGERGANTFYQALKGVKWFFDHHFNLSIAGRSLSAEDQASARTKYYELLAQNEVILNTDEKLVIFPEMDTKRDVPEITTACWDLLKKNPGDQMCASERMVVKRKGESTPKVLPCTLLAYDTQFELGTSLKNSAKRVYLNHEFCAQFCVLGGASCSTTK